MKFDPERAKRRWREIDREAHNGTFGHYDAIIDAIAEQLNGIQEPKKWGRWPWQQEPSKWVGTEHVYSITDALGQSGEREFIFRDLTEIVDVAVEAPEASDVRLVLIDQGVDRVLADVRGPWLFRREVALVDLLSTVYDAVENQRQNALEVMRDAMLAATGLRESIVPYGPHGTIKIQWWWWPIELPSPITRIWLRAIKWKRRNAEK